MATPAPTKLEQLQTLLNDSKQIADALSHYKVGTSTMDKSDGRNNLIQLATEKLDALKRENDLMKTNNENAVLTNAQLQIQLASTKEEFERIQKQINDLMSRLGGRAQVY
jgi:hypothetical protein